MLLCLLMLASFCVEATAQEALKAKQEAGAKKVTVTLVRWPYT